MIKKKQWVPNQIDLNLFNLAFQEDLGFPQKDITGEILFKPDEKATATIISKQETPIVLCGLAFIKPLADLIDPSIKIESPFHDGDTVLPRDIIVTLHGKVTSLLKLERTLLNFFQRLSGIATTTAQYVNLIKGTDAKILDTRKTVPGFRHLDKYAVSTGGGCNHRQGLYDAIMIKDTHIDSLGDVVTLLNRLPNDILNHYAVIVEVRDREELRFVLEHGQKKVTRVLLDNMTLSALSDCVTLAKGKVTTEASGGIHLDNVKNIAETGVDFISIGKLTHSVNAIDLSMIIKNE